VTNVPEIKSLQQMKLDLNQTSTSNIQMFMKVLTSFDTNSLYAHKVNLAIDMSASLCIKHNLRTNCKQTLQKSICFSKFINTVHEIIDRLKLSYSIDREIYM